MVVHIIQRGVSSTIASLIFCLLKLHSVSSFATVTISYTTSSVHQKSTALNASSKHLHLLTFDLDDTIFPITPVVSDANVAQLQTLHKYGYTDACNDQIIAASKQIRTELRQTGSAITYTDLRKLSIRREIERISGLTNDIVHETVIESTFNEWLSERHASADRNLYPHATFALEVIQNQHPNVVIGAITNGRGNPLDMPSIANHFDFCISGEDEGVFPKRKPDRGIYDAAIIKYNTMRGDRQDDEHLNWIHVEDDLANDVGASASCGATAIWFKMEDEEEEGAAFWSTATKEETEKRKALDDKAKQHVSATVGSLKELPDAIAEVLEG